MNIRALMGGLVIGTVIALILYFFVLDREAPADAPVRLAFPVDCVIGEDCWYMAFMDLDAGPGYRDHMCGFRTYEAHKGTDIAPLDERIGTLDVLAAAPGRVVGTRDGLGDRPMLVEDPVRDGQRCGNGVRLDHGDGWTSQYCHMARGSVAVRTGETVQQGQLLGMVGSSGWSELPHLHFQLERDGVPVDPFVARQPVSGQACELPGADRAGLWQVDAERGIDTYRPVVIRRVGLVDERPGRERAKRGDYSRETTVEAEVLVAYTVLFGAPEGARIDFEIEGPAGETVHERGQVLTRGYAEYFSFSGTRRKASAWPPGVYTARVSVSGVDARGEMFRVRDRAGLIVR